MGSSNAHLDIAHAQSHQGVCADAIAAIEGISRHDLEALAVASEAKAAVALAEGRFDRSLVPVTDADGRILLATDEFPRPGMTLESLEA